MMIVEFWVVNEMEQKELKISFEKIEANNSRKKKVTNKRRAG